MSEFEFDTSNDMSAGGTFLREPGTYHVAVVQVDENPSKRDGSLIDNAAFRVHLEVLAGTVGGQESKSTDIVFFHPKATDKNEGEWKKKLMSRFALAVGLISEADVAKKVKVDLQQAVGRHFIVKLEHDDEQKFLRVAFADIYHVDDPAVKEIPKNAAAMKMGGAWRLAGAKTAKSPVNGTAKTQPVKQPQPAAWEAGEL